MKNQLTIITNPVEPDGRTGYGETIVNALQSLSPKRVKITIEEYRLPRTTAQNAYYWAVIIKGYQRYFQANNQFLTNDQIHQFIQEFVWKDYVDIDITAQIHFRKILSSTRLDTMEWEHRMTQARAYAAENFNGMQLAEPNEKITKEVLEWLEAPSGVYYDWEYRNYFTIIDAKSKRVDS